MGAGERVLGHGVDYWDDCKSLGGSWVVISGVYKSLNIGYNYSYPTYKPRYNYPLNLQVGMLSLRGSAVDELKGQPSMATGLAHLS